MVPRLRERSPVLQQARPIQQMLHPSPLLAGINQPAHMCLSLAKSGSLLAITLLLSKVQHFKNFEQVPGAGLRVKTTIPLPKRPCLPVKLRRLASRRLRSCPKIIWRKKFFLEDQPVWFQPIGVNVPAPSRFSSCHYMDDDAQTKALFGEAPWFYLPAVKAEEFPWERYTDGDGSSPGWCL